VAKGGFIIRPRRTNFGRKPFLKRPIPFLKTIREVNSRLRLKELDLGSQLGIGKV